MKKETGDIKFNNASELKEYLVAKKENLMKQMYVAGEVCRGALAFCGASVATGIAFDCLNISPNEELFETFVASVALSGAVGGISNIVKHVKMKKLKTVGQQLDCLEVFKDDPEKLEAICGIKQTVESSDMEEVLEN